MYECKHMLVGLDLSETDVSTVRYAGLISHLTPAERVTFLHVGRELNVAESRELRYPQLPEPLGIFARGRMQETIANHFHGHPDTEVIYDAIQGTPLSEFLHRARQHDTDLILVGKTRHSVLPGKLARKAPCPILIVPQHAPSQITRLLVPIDFSDHAALAMETALAVARVYGVACIVCPHVYEVPQDFRAEEITDAEMTTIARQHAQKACDAFMARFDLGDVSVKPVLTTHDHIEVALQEIVTTEAADLIVMGARGRTVAAALLLGSVTEKLIWTTRVPLLVMKAKGEPLGLLDVLLHHPA